MVWSLVNAHPCPDALDATAHTRWVAETGSKEVVGLLRRYE